jgi:carboxymethylenebutenolidase
MSILTETTTYRARDGVNVSTYIARPAGAGPYPTLVLGYEFWGMLEVPAGAPHMRDCAARFAENGYVAAIPDYYAARGQQPTMEGGTIVGSPTDEQSSSDLIDAVDWLEGLPYVDAERMGVIGWCGGGRQAWFLAARCAKLRAAASFYGRPINPPARQGPSPIDLIPQMKCALFGGFGAADAAIPIDSVEKFRDALVAQGKTAEIHIYPNGKHAFMNDRRPEGYDRESADAAWHDVFDFFERYLGSSTSPVVV